MEFLIQHNMLNEKKLLEIKDAVQKFPHRFVGAIPFTEELASNEPIEGTDFIPYGSTLLTRIAQERQWNGVHYDLSKLNYENFTKNHPQMLNNIVKTVAEIVRVFETGRYVQRDWFLRPSNDDKRWAGIVMKESEILDWFRDMINTVSGSYKIEPDVKVVIDIPKKILAEWRWFIVGGKIVSGSMYRAHDQMRLLRETDQAVIDEAQQLADIWLPCDCVVMDTCLTEHGVKVIEFNCINSSGFYDNDIEAVFKALWDYHKG